MELNERGKIDEMIKGDIHQVKKLLPPSRETSLVITKLQEAQLWLHEVKLEGEE